MLDKQLQQAIIQKNRDFMKGNRDCDPNQKDFESDQQLRLPQPPLVKAPMRGEEAQILLPTDFEHLNLKNDLVSLFRDRKSERVYTEGTMNLLQLSFLLWASQGVKGIRGKSYATLRTVPSGGARHPYETYLAVRKVEGLRNGLYHYLPMKHAIEFLGCPESLDEKIIQSMSGQKWCGRANVIFYWSMVAYRAEWRYGIYAQRVALIDAGHIGQNLYLAAEAQGLGCCGVAAVHDEECSALFSLDGKEEFAVYAAPIGTVNPENKAEEQAFYRFVKEQNL